MKESLEVRVPLLDEDLFDFALSFHIILKLKAEHARGFCVRLPSEGFPRRLLTNPKGICASC